MTRTNFTLGDAVNDAANELRSFVESQLPCADVTLSGNTLTVEYGALAGNCTYRGQTYHGTHAITVTQSTGNQLIVDHDYDGFANNEVTLDGTAHVTWDFDSQSRRVQYNGTWGQLDGGSAVEGSGDVEQRSSRAACSAAFAWTARAWTSESTGTGISW